MPNTFDATGLTIETLPEIITKLTDGNKAIYGADINVDSNSPDGQNINIYAQQARDTLEVLQNINNAFDPMTAIGPQQDRLYYNNGIIRNGATYSNIQINITVDRALTLQGLDANANNANGIGYTIMDNLGNNWILLDSQSPVAPGTYNYTFRSQLLGAINSAPDTITLPVTVVLGVTTINNPTGASTLGANAETDAAFRLRFARSFATKATSSLDGMYADLLNILNVVDAKVYENKTSSTDSNSIPGHSIWAIVDGGADADIAQIIYADLNEGCGMKGSTTFDITTIQNQTFTAKFDRPISETLFYKFNLKSTKAGQSFDLTAIKTFIANNQIYTIGQYADSSSLTYQSNLAIINSGGQGIPLDAQISVNGTTWVDYLDTATIQNKWVLDEANITITVI